MSFFMVCRRCGKVASYNSHFGSYYCSGCGELNDEEVIKMNAKIEKLKNERPDLFDRLDKVVKLVTSERRQNFDKFLVWACDNTDYIGGPASTKFHLAEPYGLLEHSLNVAENALKIKEAISPDISDESCVICGLFHDFGKAGHPGKPKYIKCEATEKQKKYGFGPSQPYRYTEDEGVHLTVPQQALYYLTRFMKLSLEEYQAILIHDGQYVEENKDYACKEEPLALILHYADSWSGFVIEKRIF